MEGMRIGLQRLPKNTVADAAYGGEESYDYLKQHGPIPLPGKTPLVFSLHQPVQD